MESGLFTHEIIRLARAIRRKQLMDHYQWDEGKGMFMDYDCKEERRPPYETVTCLWTMWAGLASNEQAHKLVYVISSFSSC